MSDLEFQNFSTVQSNLQPKVATIASAATITPVGFITRVTGTAAIVNITPPVSGQHMLVLIPAGAFTGTTAGNIAAVITAAAVGIPILLFYDNVVGKYYPGETVAT